MRDSKENRRSSPFRKEESRTTIVLSRQDREFLDRLIAEGKEKGIKSFISKMLDVYRSMAIYDWRYPGEYYSGVSRVAFVAGEIVNGLIDAIPQDRRRDEGRRIGQLFRVSLEASGKASEGMRGIIEHLRVLGFGDIVSQGELLILRNSFLTNPEFACGFLESVLGVELDVVMTSPAFAFKLKGR